MESGKTTRSECTMNRKWMEKNPELVVKHLWEHADTYRKGGGWTIKIHNDRSIYMIIEAVHKDDPMG